MQLHSDAGHQDGGKPQQRQTVLHHHHLHRRGPVLQPAAARRQPGVHGAPPQAAHEAPQGGA